MPHASAEEVQAAITAVTRAASVCQGVHRALVTQDTITKKDKSPVTVADFASQAIVSLTLTEALGDLTLVGEEDAADLRPDDAAATRDKVTAHVGDALDRPIDPDAVLVAIDDAAVEPDPPTGRFWTLDPIDGTKGFLRGDQYAVALALIENGKPILGVLGCPNLQIDGVAGLMMVAAEGQGTTAHALDASVEPRKVTVDSADSPAGGRFCESVESGHSDQSSSAKIAERLGITQPPYRIDSQCKYAAVARGDASIYLRLPTRPGYSEKIWDHGAGAACVTAAGGTVTDIEGKPLDFTHGRTLKNNRGIVATNGKFHDQVVAAVQAVLNG
ncbi:MAG: 3'(2'),5'-bisphosphate nucleotidase [Planctomycetota bacterium]